MVPGQGFHLLKGVGLRTVSMNVSHGQTMGPFGCHILVYLKFQKFWNSLDVLVQYMFGQSDPSFAKHNWKKYQTPYSGSILR
jgi:hypothetical protein